MYKRYRKEKKEQHTLRYHDKEVLTERDIIQGWPDIAHGINNAKIVRIFVSSTFTGAYSHEHDSFSALCTNPKY